MSDWLRVFLMGGLPLAVFSFGFAEQGRIELRDKGRVIVSGVVRGSAEPTVIQDSSSEPAKDLFLGYPHGPKTSEFVPKGAVKETQVYQVLIPVEGGFEGVIHASGDSMACESRDSAMLGSSFGAARDGRFNAVYDRAADQLISVEGSGVEIHQGPDGFAVHATGPFVVRVLHDYLKNHQGYFLWHPTHKLWPVPVAGWCSWMAYLQDVNASEVRDAAKFFSANLREYGYDVIQIDDGYQRTPQSGDQPIKKGEKFSDFWTKPNEKFSGGMEALAHDIAALGMTPGIWIGLYLPLGLEHAEGYVTDPDGKPHRGPWVNYAVNGLDKVAADEAYWQTIREFHRQGWRYFKIDTLRHILYDNYRQTPEYWKAKKQSEEQAYRAILDGIKREIGPDCYLLACWGTLPELAGIPDGCRIGEDVGPNLASMRRSAKYIAQFHYLNNVVWRNDPDYMCLRLPLAEAQSWVTLTALAGGHLMVSDPVQDYDPARVELLRKVGPPMMLKPRNVAAHAPDPEFMTLAAEKNGEAWTVAARFAWQALPSVSKPLSELGLKPDADYLAFDFWQSKFLGVVRGNVPFSDLEAGGSQTISLRPALGHPQVLGTDRHVGQGVVELDAVKWDGKTTLSGRMLCGKGARWTLFLHVPAGWKLKTAPAGAEVTADGEVVRIRLPEQAGFVAWKAVFVRA